MRAYLMILMMMAALVISALAPLAGVAHAQDAREIERRIITYVKNNLEPGKPLLVTKLYNEVFTSPAERKVLDKLNRVFFRIPLFIVEHQVTQERLPTLEEIAGQFDFYGPEEADVVLSIMESDPRVPKFINRDPETRELVGIDVDKVKADSRFNQVVERAIAGWEGKAAPAVSGMSYDGEEMSLSAMKGKTVLLYVWFTNCPPCVRITPELVALHEKYSGRGFTVLGANADKVLGLSYDDVVRAEYVKNQSISFPLIHLTPESRKALGGVNIFPTLFLVNAEGTIANYYVSYQPFDVLEKDVQAAMAR